MAARRLDITAASSENVMPETERKIIRVKGLPSLFLAAIRSARASVPLVLTEAQKSFTLTPWNWPSKPSEYGANSRPCISGRLDMRLMADELVEKVTLTPILTRRLANCREGLSWPWAGKTARRT
nr:hypothetical protein Itr_chr12CG09780 [Ipomoea trifida]